MDEIRQALQAYFSEWREWLKVAPDFDFTTLTPMHAGWKLPNEPALMQKVGELFVGTHAGHIGTVDKRKIVLVVPNEPIENVPVLQLMQLRPSSNDALGLDHVAFYCPDIVGLRAVLKDSPQKWEQQTNSPSHSWLSMWFGPHRREAKFFDHTSLDLAVSELSAISVKIKQKNEL